MKYLLLILSALFVFGCGSEKVKPDIDASIRVEELPAQESWNSTVFFSDSGKTKAILDAGHIRVFGESKETLLDQGVKVRFYDEEEKLTSTLTSKKGRVNDATRDLYAEDSVVVVSEEGTKITTEELMWRNKDRKIVSDQFVTIVTEKEKIQGYGFESDQSLQNYTIYNITYVTRLEEQKNEK